MKPNNKDIFREIKKTITKFISIILIVAMGVFVLVGLISTGDIMRDTLEEKIKSQAYPDIFVTAPLGFEIEDEYILENQNNISELEYGYDIDLNIKDSSTLVKLMNMPQKLAMPIILEGRAPKKNEILLDVKLRDSGYKIGDKIYFSHEKNKFQDNKDDKDALLKYDFKVVGFAKSLDYIQNRNRGFSQRGLGEISGFGYIDSKEFNSDRTICKIIYKDTVNYKTSSKKYRDTLDEKYNSLKIDMKFRPTNRLKSIKSKLSKEILEGEDELSKAERALLDGKDEIDRNKDILSAKEKEYLEGLAKFKRERDNGSKELRNSKDELYKASLQLKDGGTKLANGYEKLQDGKKILDNSKEKLENGKKELTESKIKYERGKAQEEIGEKVLNESEKQIEDGRKKLDAIWAKIEESKKKLNDGKRDYNEGLNEYLYGSKLLEDGKKKLIDSLGISGLNYEEVSSLIKTLSLGIERAKPIYEKSKIIDDEIKSSQDKINALNDEIKNVLNEEDKVRIQEEIKKEEIKLNALKLAKKESDRALKEINDMLPDEYNIEKLPELISKLEMAKTGIADIENNEKKLIEAKTKLEDAKEKIEDGEKQLKDGIKEAENGEMEYAQSKSKFDEKKIELENAKRELEDAKIKLEDAENKIRDSEAKYESGLKDYERGYNEYIDNKAKYDKSKAKYESGIEEYDRGKNRYNSEIKKGENTLNDAHRKLNDGKAKLREGENKYNRESIDAREKISEGRSDINKAKRYLNIIKEPRYSITPRYLVNDINIYLDYALRCDGLALVFPVFFFAIALLVCFTTMTRMVEEQRIIIGTYKALGYSNKSIAMKFFIYGAIASLIGGIIGAVSGTYILTYIVGNAYSTGSIFENQLIIKPYIVKNLFSILMGFIFTAIAAVFTTSKNLKENTASLLRAKPPKKGTRIFFERIKFIWNRLSFIKKVTARNIFRSKKRMIMTIIGIMGCCALLILGFGIEGSVRNIAKFQFDEILQYNIAISFDRDIDEDSYLQYTKYLKDKNIKYASIYEESMKVDYSKKDQLVEVIATDNEKEFNDYIKLRDPKNKKEIKFPKRGVIISKKLSKIKHLKVGDVLKIRDVYDNEFEVEVKDISEMYIGHYIYMNSDYFEKVMGKDFKVNTHLIKSNGIKDLSKFEKDVINYKCVVNVLNANKLKDTLERFIYPIEKIEMIIIIVSSLLALVVLYNLTNINIEERKREIATIKVLGFYSNETTAYIYRETYILTILGIILGFIVGKLLHYLILQIVVPYEGMLSDYLIMSAYLKAAIITIIVTTITMFIFQNKIKKINMVESLKSNE